MPGVVSATCGHIAGVQTEMAETGLLLSASVGDAFTFLAVYKIEADDPSAVLAEVIARNKTPKMPLSEHLGETQTIFYEMLSVTSRRHARRGDGAHGVEAEHVGGAAHRDPRGRAESECEAISS